MLTRNSTLAFVFTFVCMASHAQGRKRTTDVYFQNYDSTLAAPPLKAFITDHKLSIHSRYIDTTGENMHLRLIKRSCWKGLFLKKKLRRLDKNTDALTIRYIDSRPKPHVCKRRYVPPYNDNLYFHRGKKRFRLFK